MSKTFKAFGIFAKCGTLQPGTVAYTLKESLWQWEHGTRDSKSTLDYLHSIGYTVAPVTISREDEIQCEHNLNSKPVCDKCGKTIWRAHGITRELDGE